VTFNSTLIGTFTRRGDDRLTDTGLSIGSTYYYAVMTVDTNDTYSASNERSTTTVPLTLPDERRNGEPGPVGGDRHVGDYDQRRARRQRFADRLALRDYANNSDTYALTAVKPGGHGLARAALLGPVPVWPAGITRSWRFRPTGAIGIGLRG